MPDSSISIGSSYQDRGFWFQPNKIDSQDERVWSGYKFLSKYFDMSKLSSTEPSYNSYDTFNVDNYMGGSFDYEIDSYKDYRGYDSVFEDYYDKISSIDSSDTGSNGYFDAYFNLDFGGSEEIAAEDGFSYDNVYNEYNNSVESMDGEKRPQGAINFDVYYNGNYNICEEVAAADGFSYDSAMNDFRERINGTKSDSASQNNYGYNSVLEKLRQDIGADGKNNTSKSCIQLDYDKYYNSYFS